MAGSPVVYMHNLQSGSASNTSMLPFTMLWRVLPAQCSITTNYCSTTEAHIYKGSSLIALGVIPRTTSTTTKASNTSFLEVTLLTTSTTSLL
jgi:hypothetical protein